MYTNWKTVAACLMITAMLEGCGASDGSASKPRPGPTAVTLAADSTPLPEPTVVTLAADSAPLPEPRIITLAVNRTSLPGPTAVTLAADGVAIWPVVVAPIASPRTRAAARVLATHLEAITGAVFTVIDGDGATGIAVGVSGDHSGLYEMPQLADTDSLTTEAYALRSHPDGLAVIAATEDGIEHAIWGLLDQLGYRRWFPSAAWEHVPSLPDATLAVDALWRPRWLTRRIWYGYGTAPHNDASYDAWSVRNRTVSAFSLWTSHAWERIIDSYPDTFAAHPEYRGQIDGVPTNKFCISEPGLVQLVIDDALAYFAAYPDLRTYSVEPSDHGGWEGCPGDAAIGTPSDRVVTLANAVAEAVVEAYGDDRFVAFLAYNEHSHPPSLDVHPNVVVSVATGFIKGGWSLLDLVDAWVARGAIIGIYEYWAVHHWDQDLPGKARAASWRYVEDSLGRFHEAGARFLSSESGDGWGTIGTSHWIAAGLMWEQVAANGNVVRPSGEALYSAFLNGAYGPAEAPLRDFHDLISGHSEPALMSAHLLGEMYRHLGDGLALANAAGDTAVQSRILDLVTYTRYVELFRTYSNAVGEDRQAAFELLIRHGWRTRYREMIHVEALYRDLVTRDPKVAIPPEALWYVAENTNPWKQDAPPSDAEIESWINSGAQAYPHRGFDAKTFGDALVPAKPLALEDMPRGSWSYHRGVVDWHTWVDTPGQTLPFSVRGGLVYNDRGNVQVALAAAGSNGTPADQAAVPSDSSEIHEVALVAAQTGHHTVTFSDGGGGADVSWPEGTPMTMTAFASPLNSFVSLWSAYFYVPVGTETVGGWGVGGGTISDPDGTTVYTFDDRPAGYFAVPVGPGQDGRLWVLHNSRGPRVFMTVPPYMAIDETELLLPEEVVDSDAP